MVGVLHKITVCVDHLHEDVGHRVGGYPQGVGLAAGLDLIGGSVVSLTQQGTGLVVDVLIEHACLLVALEGTLHRLSVQQQLGVLAIGVTDNADAVALLVVPSIGSVGGDAGTLPSLGPIGLIGPMRYKRCADVAYGLLAPQRSAIPAVGLALSCQIEQSGAAAAGRPRAALA